MKKPWSIFSFVAMLLFIGLACKTIGIGNQNSEGTNPSPEPAQQINTQVVSPTTVPLLITQLPTIQSPAQASPTIEVTGEESICQSDKWKIIPERVLTFPGDNGFKKIVIPYVIKNDSPYWGRLRKGLAAEWTVTTEDGFIYKTGATVEDSLQDIYQSYGQLNVLGNTIWTSLPEPDFSYRAEVYLPSGYVFRGYDLETNVDAWRLPQLVFQVAETQNQFTISLNSLYIECIHDDGQIFEENLNPVILNLSTDIQTLPNTDLSLLPSQGINAPIILDDIGKLEYQGTKLGTPTLEDECFRDYQNDLDVCYVMVLYRFTNASTGYETKLNIDGLYLIGDDGILRPQSGWVETSVGPGQSTDITIRFSPGPKTDRLMIIWTYSSPYRIIDLPTIIK